MKKLMWMPMLASLIVFGVVSACYASGATRWLISGSGQTPKTQATWDCTILAAAPANCNVASAQAGTITWLAYNTCRDQYVQKCLHDRGF